MLSKITDTIWLGSELDSLVSCDADAVLSVAIEPLPRGLQLVTAKCGLLELHALLQLGHKVMVHCLEGMSRSPFIVAAYLAITASSNKPANIKDYVSYVTGKHPITNIRPEHLAFMPDLWILQACLNGHYQPVSGKAIISS
jgi:hypothetical protein